MTAGIVVHSEKTLVMKQFPYPVPVLPLHLRRILHSHFLECRNLYAGIENRPVGTEVGVSSAVGLHVGVLGSEETLCRLDCLVLDFVNVVASRIEAVEREALGILVGKEVAHCGLYGERGEILACDELEIRSLVPQFLHDSSRRRRGNPCDKIELGKI